MSEANAASVLKDGLPITGTIKPRRKRRKKKKKKSRASENSANTKTCSDDDDSDDDDDVGGSFINTIASKKANSNSNIISTQQELLLRRLSETDGYEVTLVEQAMEEMWNKRMRFDEYDYVLKYLQGGVGMCGTTASTASISVEESDEEMDYVATSILHLNPIDPSSSYGDLVLQTEENVEETTVTMNGDIDFTHGEEDEEDCERKNEESVEQIPTSTSTPTPTPTPTPPPPATMMEKLDTVAGFGNLTDAIFALTQWVKLAANEKEIELFCRAEKTTALFTVVRRGISSEIEDIKSFEQAVQPAVVRLLMAVLNRCGIDELEAGTEAELEERMENMLKQARKVSLLAADDRNIKDDEAVIGDRVSRFIAYRLTVAMDEMKEYDRKKIIEVNNNENCRQEERARTSNIGNDNDNDIAMVTLISQRDALKANATRACTTVQNSMKSIFDDTAANGSSSTAIGHSNGSTNGHAGLTSSTISLEIQDITLQIVDEETKNRFVDEKVWLESLKSQVQDEGESSETVLSLRESVLSLETKRLGYQEKIAELKAALEELETQDEDAAIQIKNISTQIGEEERNDDAKAKQLEQDISAAKESVRYGNLVCSLAGMMKTYGKSIEKATASKTGKAIHKDSMNVTPNHNNDNNKTAAAEVITKASVSRAMEDYLSKIRNYFLKEALCATQLRHRVATKTTEVTALRSELSQYNSVKGLGETMSTIILQIEESVAEKERTIQADTQRIAALTDDGRFMYDELLARTETYHANAIENSGSTDVDNGDDIGTDTDDVLRALFPTVLLREVPAAIRALNIVQDCDCDRLVPFVKERAAEPVPTANDSETIESTSIQDGSSTNGSTSPTEDHVLAAQSPPTTIAAAAAEVVLTPSVAPRFAWATTGAKQASSQEKHSLLDIQKEEEERIRSRESSSQSSVGE